jgi:acyl-CoA dehydrogenase
MCLVEEELGRTADALIRRVFGQVYEMLLECRGEQRERYLYPTVRGDKITCLGLTEPNAGSDAANIETAAERAGDVFVLNGRKHFISDGDIADYAIVFAVTDKALRARGGITAFLVDRGTPGFTVGRIQPMMGHRGYHHTELVFEDCQVPASQVLGEVGQGFKLVMTTLSRVRLAHIGARAVGMAERLLEMARAHALSRRQFGRAIAEFQLIQGMLADSATEAYATRLMVYNTAWEIDQGRDVRAKISMVKLYASEMQSRVVDRVLQIFGGMGFCKELPVERMYRDARVTRIYDGTSEIHRTIIARHVLKQGLPMGVS